MHTADGLAYEDRGQGEPALLIHGAAVATTFVPLMREPVVADHYRLLRYHRRGFAESAPLEDLSGWTGQRYATSQAEDALLVLRHAGVERAHVVGHSGGGWVAVQLALDAPEVVHSLVLMEPAIYAMKPSWKDASARSFDRLRDLHASDPDAAAERFLAAVEGPAWRSFADALPGGSAAWIEDTKAMFFELGLVLDWTFGADEAARITQPVLWITGGKSPPFLENVRALFTEWVPQTEGVVIADEGHNMFTQRPGPAATEIASFLARHPMA